MFQDMELVCTLELLLLNSEGGASRNTGRLLCGERVACFYFNNGNEFTKRLCLGPSKGGRGISDVSSVWNYQGCRFDPLLYISSLVLLPSPVALSVLSFYAFGPFS